MIELKRSHAILIVAAVALLVYANSLWNGFAYDDSWIIVRNTRVRDLTDLHAIFLTPYWPNYGPELGLYRPLIIFLFALQWAVAGNAPWFFHLSSVLAHAAVCVFVLLLVEQLISRRAAFAAALIFAVHPLHTEAVANVVGQAEIWAALGVLGACLIYVTRPAGVAISWNRRLGILAIYACVLLIKESAVVLPGLLVLLDFAQRRVQLTRDGLLRYIKAVDFMLVALAIVLCAYLTLRVSVLGNLAGVDAAPGLPFLREEHRILNALRAWPEYMRLLFLPIELSVDYAPAIILPVESFTPMVMLGALLAVGTFVLMLVTPWQPRAGLVAGWFLLTVLPVANLLFPIGVLVAERTLYLPSLAVCLMAGIAWEALARPQYESRRRLIYGFAALIVVLFAARTVIRNPDWKSLAAVWQGLRRDHPESYRAQWVNASEMWYRGNADLAEKYFVIANRLWHRDSQLQAELGGFYIAQRRYREAVHYLELSRTATPFVVPTYYNLAYAYLMADRPRDAIPTAWQAMSMGGQSGFIFGTIASAYHKLGRYDQAAGAWRAATSQKTGNLWLYWAMMARSLALGGHDAAALDAAAGAAQRAQGTPAAEATVASLQTAIRQGCFPDGEECDPLHGWIIGVPAAGNVANRQSDAKRNAPAVLPGPAPAARVGDK